VGIFPVLKLIAYSLPSILILTIPMGVLLASLMSFGKLASENEITAIKASGINLSSIISPLLLIGFLISLALVLFYDRVIPFCNYKFFETSYMIGQKRPTLELREHAFNDLGEMRVYINRINVKTSTLEDIIISENNPESSKFITADKGQIFLHPDGSKLTLQLTNGAIHQTETSDSNRYQSLLFNVHNLVISLEKTLKIKRERMLEEMNNMEIKKEIERYKTGKININPFLVELYRRASLPFACLSFTLLGIPLGLRSKHKSKSISFGISLLVIFLYYLILIGAETMGIRGTAPPVLTMWAPNAILGTIGLVLLIKSIK
jgi:lipopolysaccharide export LptBFGC system permease protein LptF